MKPSPDYVTKMRLPLAGLRAVKTLGHEHDQHNDTPRSRDGDVEPVRVSDEPHLPAAVAADERADKDIALFALIIVHCIPR